ncbi:MAG: CAP domain-containing protein [Pseudomonadota bacterium]
MSNLTPNEQYMLELINRARSDPAAEAARLGIDLNEGLSPGRISPDEKQPLAANDLLNRAAADHSRDMLNFNYFDHTGRNGSDVGDRIEAAGYTGWRTWGENISYRGGGDVQSVAVIEGHHDGLFRSSGHRTNLMNNGFTEIGIGQEFGQFNNFNASMLTQNFASDRGDPFLLGVVFDDQDGDNFFDPGEELPGVSVTVSGEGSVVTGPGGGYELRVDNGQSLTVTFAGGALGQTVTRSITVGDENVKLDLNADDLAASPQPSDPAPQTPDEPDPTTPVPSGPTTPAPSDPPNPVPSGPVTAGSDADDVMTGSSGADRIKAGSGADLVRGADGDDWLNGQAGEDRLRGGSGDDTLKGGAGADHVKGQAGDDRLIGGRDDDTLKGGSGDDELKGQAGDDRLIGGGGDDTLNGGTGADLLAGGAGTDSFQFSGRAGNDLIRDFEDGIDSIQLRGSDDSFADLTIASTAQGHALVTYAGGTIVLRNLDADDLSGADFVFV